VLCGMDFSYHFHHPLMLGDRISHELWCVVRLTSSQYDAPGYIVSQLFTSNNESQTCSMPPVQPRGVLIHVDVYLLHPYAVGDTISRFGWTCSHLRRVSFPSFVTWDLRDASLSPMNVSFVFV
jgi:hypothetical protein